MNAEFSSIPSPIAVSLPGKIQPRHRQRLAAVYVRQSTLQQVEHHQESTRLQYALVERAVALGYYRGVLKAADALEQADPGCAAFAARVRELAGQFRFDAIAAMLQPADATAADTAAPAGPNPAP